MKRVPVVKADPSVAGLVKASRLRRAAKMNAVLVLVRVRAVRVLVPVVRDLVLPEKVDRRAKVGRVPVLVARESAVRSAGLVVPVTAAA